MTEHASGTFTASRLGYNDFVRRLDNFGGPRVGLVVKQDSYAPHVRVRYGMEVETRSADIMVKVDREIVYAVTSDPKQGFPSLRWSPGLHGGHELWDEAAHRDPGALTQLWRVEVPRYDLDLTLRETDFRRATERWLGSRRPSADHAHLIRSNARAGAHATKP